MTEGDVIEDVITKAGGLTKTAYPFGAVFESEEVKEINRLALQNLYEDSLDNILQLIKTTGAEADFTPLIEILSQIKDAEPSGRVIIDLNSETERNSVLLKDKDSILIPEISNQVYVYGSVSSNGGAKFKKDKKAKYYIDKMGGFVKNSDQNGAYVLYPNGETIKLSKNKNIFTSQKNDITIYPGSIIYVPEVIDGGYASRLNVAAYASILGNIGVTLASLSVLKD
tara:strand:- start:36 stop:713 length:678 start_codon:yes stop_codon:yes gene_type:complete